MPQKGVLYMLTLVMNNGLQRRIWAFGVNQIMEIPDPIDLRPVRKLFPHLPDNVFAPLMKKPVDLLIGNNFFNIHPDGGQGINCVGDLRALQSQLGLGWIIAGTHSLLKAASTPTLSAACITRVNRCEIMSQSSPTFTQRARRIG